MQNVGNGLKRISLTGRGHMLKTLESKDIRGSFGKFLAWHYNSTMR